jgi:hypothetical protein
VPFSRQGAQGARLANVPTGFVPGPVVIDGNGSASAGSSLTFAALPDMTVTDITWAPTTPVPGDQVVFSAVVQNIGAGPTPDGTIVDCLFTISQGGTQVTTTWEDNQTAAIAAGVSVTMVANGSNTVGVNYWTATAGTYQVDAYVNSNIRFSETDRTNNHLVETISVGVAPPGAPSAPVLNAVPGNGTVALSWNVPANNGSAITSYRLRRDGVILNPPDTTTTATVYTDNAVANNVAYSYTVAAVNAVGEGAPSSPVVATPFTGTGVPVLLPDITAAVPASKMIALDSFKPATLFVSQIGTWKSTMGFAGYGGTLGGVGVQGTQLMLGSTAVGQNSNYDWQQAYEGFGVPTINGQAYGTPVNLGLKKAFAADPTLENYLVWGLAADMSTLFDDPTWTALNAKWATRAAGAAFLNCKGLYFDTENPTWDPTAQAPPAGKTEAQVRTQLELRGYQMGIQIYTNFLDCNILIYHPVPGRTFYDTNIYNPPNGVSNLTLREMCYVYGLMRAGAQLNNTGRFAYLDHHLGYRVDTGGTGASMQTAIKWSTQGMLAEFSQTLPDASRDHWMSLIDYRLYTWSSCDPTPFYFDSELSVADYNSQLELARQWSMGGRRHEFSPAGQPGDAENVTRNPGGQHSKWFGQSPYTFPTGRQAGMLAATSTTPQDNSSIVVGTIAQSRAFNTVTLTFTAQHPFGIAHVHWTLFAANGTTIAGQGESKMVMNLNGGTRTAGIPNQYMDCTAVVANGTAGLYVTLDVYSTVGQRTSRRVALV